MKIASPPSGSEIVVGLASPSEAAETVKVYLSVVKVNADDKEGNVTVSIVVEIEPRVDWLRGYKAESNATENPAKMIPRSTLISPGLIDVKYMMGLEWQVCAWSNGSGVIEKLVLKIGNNYTIEVNSSNMIILRRFQMVPSFQELSYSALEWNVSLHLTRDTSAEKSTNI
jgi:hypothetical protein